MYSWGSSSSTGSSSTDVSIDGYIRVNLSDSDSMASYQGGGEPRPRGKEHRGKDTRSMDPRGIELPRKPHHKSQMYQAYKGQLKLSAYINCGLLTVHVVMGRHVKADWPCPCTTYIKVCLIPDESKRTKCKTDLVHDTNNPLYDEKFSFELIQEDADKRLYVSCWHKDRQRQQCEFLGSMSFGIQSILRKPVGGWYYLLTGDLGYRKHLQVTEKKAELRARSRPNQNGPIPEVNQDLMWMEPREIVIRRGKSGFGFSISGACPVHVSRVDLGSRAESAGLAHGDVITRIDGLNVSRSTADSVARIIKHSHRSIELEVQRRRCRESVPGAPLTKGYGDNLPIGRLERSPRKPLCTSTPYDHVGQVYLDDMNVSPPKPRSAPDLPTCDFSSEEEYGVIGPHRSHEALGPQRSHDPRVLHHPHEPLDSYRPHENMVNHRPHQNMPPPREPFLPHRPHENMGPPREPFVSHRPHENMALHRPHEPLEPHLPHDPRAAIHHQQPLYTNTQPEHANYMDKDFEDEGFETCDYGWLEPPPPAPVSTHPVPENAHPRPERRPGRHWVPDAGLLPSVDEEDENDLSTSSHNMSWTDGLNANPEPVYQRINPQSPSPPKLTPHAPYRSPARGRLSPQCPSPTPSSSSSQDKMSTSFTMDDLPPVKEFMPGHSAALQGGKVEPSTGGPVRSYTLPRSFKAKSRGIIKFLRSTVSNKENHVIHAEHKHNTNSLPRLKSGHKNKGIR